MVVFSEAGQFLRRIGCETVTNFPNGIDVSDAGDVLVGDSHGNRFHVAVFNREGEMLSEFECPYVKVRVHRTSLMYLSAIVSVLFCEFLYLSLFDTGVTVLWLENHIRGVHRYLGQKQSPPSGAEHSLHHVNRRRFDTTIPERSRQPQIQHILFECRKSFAFLPVMASDRYLADTKQCPNFKAWFFSPCLFSIFLHNNNSFYLSNLL